MRLAALVLTLLLGLELHAVPVDPRRACEQSLHVSAPSLITRIYRAFWRLIATGGTRHGLEIFNKGSDRPGSEDPERVVSAASVNARYFTDGTFVEIDARTSRGRADSVARASLPRRAIAADESFVTVWPGHLPDGRAEVPIPFGFVARAVEGGRAEVSAFGVHVRGEAEVLRLAIAPRAPFDLDPATRLRLTAVAGTPTLDAYPDFVRAFVAHLHRGRRGGKLDDAALARKLSQFIRTRFTYANDAEPTRGVLELCAGRRVQCDGASLILLTLLRREFGVPCYLAGGFITGTHPEHPGARVVTTRTTPHAFVAVYSAATRTFEVFDPTPPDPNAPPDEGAVGASGAGAGDGEGRDEATAGDQGEPSGEAAPGDDAQNSSADGGGGAPGKGAQTEDEIADPGGAGDGPPAPTGGAADSADSTDADAGEVPGDASSPSEDPPAALNSNPAPPDPAAAVAANDAPPAGATPTDGALVQAGEDFTRPPETPPAPVSVDPWAKVFDPDVGARWVTVLRHLVHRSDDSNARDLKLAEAILRYATLLPGRSIDRHVREVARAPRETFDTKSAWITLEMLGHVAELGRAHAPDDAVYEDLAFVVEQILGPRGGEGLDHARELRDQMPGPLSRAAFNPADPLLFLQLRDLARLVALRQISNFAPPPSHHRFVSSRAPTEYASELTVAEDFENIENFERQGLPPEYDAVRLVNDDMLQRTWIDRHPRPDPAPERPVAGHLDATIILLDLSGSMAPPGRRGHVRDRLTQLWIDQLHGERVVLIRYRDSPEPSIEIDTPSKSQLYFARLSEQNEFFESHGGNDLDRAFRAAVTYAAELGPDYGRVNIRIVSDGADAITLEELRAAKDRLDPGVEINVTAVTLEVGNPHLQQFIEDSDRAGIVGEGHLVHFTTEDLDRIVNAPDGLREYAMGEALPADYAKLTRTPAYLWRELARVGRALDGDTGADRTSAR